MGIMSHCVISCPTYVEPRRHNLPAIALENINNISHVLDSLGYFAIRNIFSAFYSFRESRAAQLMGRK